MVLTFSPTDTFAFLCPSVQLTNDANPEMDETFTVRISNSVCAINQDTATVIIEDDDSESCYIYIYTNLIIKQHDVFNI